VQDYRESSLEDLVRICATSKETGAWQEFVHRIQPVIARTAIRTARSWTEPSRSLIDDLVQETFLKLCVDQYRILRNFREQHEGSFLAFITVITANAVRDHFKADDAAKRGSGVAPRSLDVQDANEPTSANISDPADAVLVSQIEEWLSKNANSERDQLVFWLRHRGGLTAKEISSLPSINLSTKGVESLLCRLISNLRAHLTQPHPAPTSKNREGFLNE
jgi:RNA polymerase sigma-70 factor (ECF subfamily)